MSESSTTDTSSAAGAAPTNTTPAQASAATSAPAAAPNAGAAARHNVRKKKKSRTGLIVVIVVGVLALLAVVVMMSGDGEGARMKVETTTVENRTIVQTVTATGMIDPQTQVKVSPEVSGEIVYLGVEEGQSVQKGQVLVRINPQSMMAERDEAQALISGAQSRVAQSEAGLLRSEQELERVKLLFEKKLSTQQELDAATAQVKIARAELSSARYAVAQSQAGFRRVRQSLSKTTIVSPISGIVTKLNSKLGEKVVGAIQMTGTEIMTVADLSVIEAVVNVSENDVVQVSLGDTAEVEVDAIPGQKFKAVVNRIANSPKQSGLGTQEQITNFEVRLRFIVPDPRFRPGMTATATIETDKKTNVLAVPIQSVTTRDTSKRVTIEDDEAKNVSVEKVTRKEEGPQPVVFVVQGGKALLRKVATGVRDDRYIEITSGLKAGDVVVSGSYKAITKDLKDSALVAEDAAKGAAARTSKEK